MCYLCKKRMIVVLCIAIINASLVYSDPLLKCNNGNKICANDGVCMLTALSTAHRLCDRSEVYFDGGCYELFMQPVSWDRASNNCQLAGGGLVTIENDSQRRFVSSYILSQFDEVKESYRGVGVWTAGHSVANHSKAAYVWMPDHYLITENYWQAGRPGVSENITDECIYLGQSTAYFEWMLSSCQQDRFYLCHHKANQGVQLMSAQCLCKRGYRGEFCEVPPDLKGKHPESQEIACSDHPFEFACSSGATIEVDFATYGFLSTETNASALCARDTTSMPFPPQKSCVALSSLQTIKNKCQGLTFCKIESVPLLFPDDPCPGLSAKSLLYRMKCSMESMTRCRKGAMYHQGRCYEVNFEKEPTKRSTWFAAGTACSQKGGNLVSTIDSSVNNQLVATMRREVGTVSNFWIGAITRASDGQPITQSGQSLRFIPPNSQLKGKNLCISYNVSPTSAVFMTSSCGELNSWICEFAPEPAKQDRRPIENYQFKQNKHTVFMGNNTVLETTVAPQVKYCEAEEWNGIQFPRTPECQQAQVPCPDPTAINGVIVRTCSCVSVQWVSTIDTSMCVHRWVSQLSDDIASNQPAEQISSSFADNLKDTLRTGMYGGDIIGSVDISTNLLSHARQQYTVIMNRDERSVKATAFTQSFGEAGDELLGSRAEETWMQLDSAIRIPKASVLMSVLEQSAILMADFIYAKQKKMEFSNWAMEVQIKRPPAPTMDDAPEPIPLPPISTNRGQEPSSNDVPDGLLGSGPSTGPTRTGPQPTGFVAALPPSTRMVPSSWTPPNRARQPPSPPEADETISFSGFSLSPSICLPSVSVLGDAMQQNQDDSRSDAMAAAPTGFAAMPRMNAASLDRNPMRLGYYIFKSVGSLLTPKGNKVINSLVIGASVNDPKKSLELPSGSPVTFTFYHIHKSNVTNPQCVFWDTTLTQWNSRGCTMLRTSPESTECSCSHLTSFAILMDVTGTLEQAMGHDSKVALDVITIVGCSISIACLLISLIVFTCFRSLWNVRNTIHRNLVLCLLIAELVFVIGIDRTQNHAVCSAIAVVLHYFFLASFCWMLLEGYQLYLMLIQVFEPDNVKILLYFLWAYGFPAVIVAVSAGVAWPSYGTPQYCWINADSSTIWAFVGPITVVIIANVVFLAVALKVVMSVRSRDRTRAERMAGWLKGSGTLLCLLGVTWVFGYLMLVSQAQVVFAYIFTILNCTQGVFIFVLHVLLNEKVRATLLRFARTRLCCGQESGAAAYNSRSYLSSRQRILNMIKGSESSNSDAQRSSRKSDASNALKANKLSVKSPLGQFDENLPQKQNSLPPAYLDFRDRLHDEGPNTAESTLESDSPQPPQNREPLPSFKGEKNSTTRRSAAPVRRKKFPLGKSQEERASQYASNRNVIVEHF